MHHCHLERATEIAELLSVHFSFGWAAPSAQLHCAHQHLDQAADAAKGVCTASWHGRAAATLGHGLLRADRSVCPAMTAPHHVKGADCCTGWALGMLLAVYHQMLLKPVPMFQQAVRKSCASIGTMHQHLLVQWNQTLTPDVC